MEPIAHWIERITSIACRIRLGMHNRYQRFLRNVVIKKVVEPERAIRLALDVKPLTPERVVANYCEGMVLFGKHGSSEVFWESFPERLVMTPENAHVPKSVKRVLKHQRFDVRRSTAFEQTMRACQREHWTWITEPLIGIYKMLFSIGFAESIEVFQDGQLVGGVWGLVVGSTYAMMSMFHSVDHAGSAAIAELVQDLIEGRRSVIDCGVPKPCFERYGAFPISEEEFVDRVIRGLVPHASCASGRGIDSAETVDVIPLSDTVET